jgi:hypothetical protein
VELKLRCRHTAACISRLGAYATDALTHQPEAFNSVLKEVDFTALGLAA